MSVDQPVAIRQEADALARAPQVDLGQFDAGSVRAYGKERSECAHIRARIYDEGSIRRPDWIECLPGDQANWRRRGRPPVSRLKPHQAATTVRHILSGCPDQLSMPFALWTREAVQELLSRKFDVQVSVWTVGRYLRAWGLTPQKPVRRAYEQNPAKVRKWLEEEYPAIREQARQFKAQIHWLDEMGLRSDHQAGRSSGLRGGTAVEVVTA